MNEFFYRILEANLCFTWSNILIFDIFVQLQEGKSALHLAAALGHSEAVAALTLNGADVSAQDFVSNLFLLNNQNIYS